MKIITNSTLRLVLVLPLMLVAGCMGASQWVDTYDYATPRPIVEYKGSGDVALAVIDNRPYIKSREYPSSYCGTVTSFQYVPHHIKTTSGNPLAEDISHSLSASLKYARLNVTEIPMDINTDFVDAATRFMGTPAAKLIVIVMNEWHSKTHIGTTLYYDVDLIVTDKNGNNLAQAKIQGSDNLARNVVDTYNFAAKEIIKSFDRQMEILLNEPAVRRALQ